MLEGDEKEVTDPRDIPLPCQSGPNISAQEPSVEDSELELSSLENELEDREDRVLKDFHEFEESLVSQNICLSLNI
jgi:hypothetical protein